MSFMKELESAIGGNDTPTKVKTWLNTGHPLLNDAISGSYHGGFPVGRMVEMFGPPSSGKCQPKDTYVLSEHGMITFEEMFALKGYQTNIRTRSEEAVTHLINERGELEPTSHFFWNGKRKVKRITGYSGMQTEATFRHPLRVLSKGCRIVWRNAGDIEVGDHLIVMGGVQQFGDGELTELEARFLGYLVADGSLNNKNRIAFSNSDEDVIADFMEAANFVEPDQNWIVSRKEGTGTVDHVCNNTVFRARLKTEYGMSLALAKDKTVPLVVRRAGQKAQIEFIRAYFEAECSVLMGIEVTSASEHLLRQVQMMLRIRPV